jgi:hypothetical protein
LKYFVDEGVIKVTKKGDTLHLITLQDLLIPEGAYYELPTGIRMRIDGEVTPLFFNLVFEDKDAAWKLVNLSPILWPTSKLSEIVLQLWNPTHQSYAIPEDTHLGVLAAYKSVAVEEVAI